jgi:hypothetical protein
MVNMASPRPGPRCPRCGHVAAPGDDRCRQCGNPRSQRGLAQARSAQASQQSPPTTPPSQPRPRPPWQQAFQPPTRWSRPGSATTLPQLRRRTSVTGRVLFTSAVREEPIRRIWLWLLVAALVMLILKFLLLPLLWLVALVFLISLLPGFGLFRRILSPPRLGMPSPGRAGAHVTVLPFRVRTTQGEQVQCVLRGTILGGTVEQGDEVEVTGWWDARRSVLDAERVRNVQTGSVTTSRLPFGAQRLGTPPGVVVGAAVLVVLLVAAMPASSSGSGNLAVALLSALAPLLVLVILARALLSWLRR